MSSLVEDLVQKPVLKASACIDTSQSKINHFANVAKIINLTLTVKGKKCSWFIPVYVGT
jgi:hypothetical protein